MTSVIFFNFNFISYIDLNLATTESVLKSNT